MPHFRVYSAPRAGPQARRPLVSARNPGPPASERPLAGALQQMTRNKKQEQLSLPDVEPAFVLEMQDLEVLRNDAARPQAVSSESPRTSARQKAAAPEKPARKPTARRKVLRTQSASMESVGSRLDPVAPQLIYQPPEDRLRIVLSSESVKEERRNGDLVAGYAADGSLVEIRLDRPGQFSAHTFPQPEVTSPLLPELLTSLRDELLFLKTGLALVLAAVLWLLLR